MLYHGDEVDNGTRIICPRCKGTGAAIYSEFIPGGYLTDSKQECRTCKGKKVVKIKLVPVEDD